VSADGGETPTPIAFRDVALKLHVNRYIVIPIAPKGTPIPRGEPADGKSPRGPVAKGWREHKDGQTAATVLGWIKREEKRRGEDARPYGCGILTTHTPAFDIDVRHPEAAQEIHDLALRMFGVLPVRYGSPPKRLLLGRTDDPFKKIETPEYVIPGYEGIHQIEILGDGQQFVAFAMHPGTGNPYRWDGPSPLDVPVSELPLITRERAEQFKNEAEAIIIRHGGQLAGKAQAPKADTAPLHEALPPGAPPCLHALARRGFGDWQNQGIFNIAVMRKKSGAEDWQALVRGDNEKLMDPRVPEGKLESIIKAVAEKDYFYKCAERPICEACDKTVCRTRSLGIGPAGPAIRYDPTDNKRMAKEGEAALIASGLPVYQQAGKIVRVVRLDAPVETSTIRRDVGAVVLTGCSTPWLLGEFMAAARWVRRVLVRKKKQDDPEEWIEQDVPLKMDVVKYYVDNAGGWNLPVLRGTVETPTLWKRDDGVFVLLQKPGYDPDSRFLYDPGSAVFPPIPEKPTKEDAEAALAELVALLKGFPFVPDEMADAWEPAADEGTKPSRARSVALSALLTGLIRRDMAAAPLHAIDAVSPGTGKGYLIRIISAILTGRQAAVMPWVRNDEEQRKRLLSVLMAGDPIIMLDNATTPIGGAALNSVLTEPIFQDRILSKTVMGNAPTNALFLVNGNNLEIEGDSVRRTVRCRMDARCERPAERVFTDDPLSVAMRQRPQLVVGGLTILCAYIAAGRPLKGKVAHLASFEDWTIIREALMWLDQPDPADTQKEIVGDDPVANEIRGIMDVWHECFGTVSVRLTEAVAWARRFDKYTESRERRLFDAFSGALMGADVTEKRLGHWFKKYDGRIVDGARFVRAEDTDGGRLIVLMKPGSMGQTGAFNSQLSAADAAQMKADMNGRPREGEMPF
jgi:putative DNA primase/helicase